MELDLDAAVTAYDRDGYWVAPLLFSADEVERLRRATARVVDGIYEGERAPTLCLPFEPGDHDLRKIDNAWWADPDLAISRLWRPVGAAAR